MVTIEATVAAACWRPISLRQDEGAIFLSLTAYGLGGENTRHLKECILGHLRELREMEVAHSSLVKNKEGEQYFLIRPFPAEGAALKAKLEAEVAHFFEDCPDDRGQLLLGRLRNAPEFGEFGTLRQELAFVSKTTPSGSEVFQINERVIEANGVESSSISYSPKSPLARERFQLLQERHLGPVLEAENK